MTRDDVRLLRDANPVPHPTPYPDDEITRRVADVLGSDQHRIDLGADAPSGNGRHRLIPAAAAAAIMVLAAGTAFVLGRDHTSGGTAGSGARTVSCAVSTDGGAPATRERQVQAAQVIKARLGALGGTVRDLVTDTADGTVEFRPHGVGAAAAVQACRRTTIAIRPVVTRPVTADGTTSRSANPLADLPFAVPNDEAAYARLSQAQRTQLDRAMSRYDCSARPAANAPALVCSTTKGSPTQVYLLAPALVADTDVRSATATRPQAAASPQWTVELRLRPAAGARVEAFTARNHAGGTTASLAQCGPGRPVACRDFLALIAEQRVISVPQTDATISTAIQVAGNFSQQSAAELAGDYTAAAVGLRPA